LLAVPAFAGDTNKEDKDSVTAKFQVSETEQAQDDGEVQTDGALPIYAIATLNMRLVDDDVIRTYAHTYTPIALDMKIDLWLNKEVSGTWYVVDYNVSTQDGGYACSCDLDDVTYQSAYDYKADSYHTTYNPSNGYTGYAWLHDTSL